MKSQDFLILEKLNVGDASAYKELFDLYYIPLSIYSLKYCDSFELAEDVVQDLFIKFWDQKLYLKLDEAISPYLFRSVKNNTIQAAKRQNRYFFEDIEDQVDVLLDEEHLDLEHLEQEKIKLYKEIEALPLKSKEVFKAIVLENRKYKDVALELGISVNTVKTHYSRALKQLRNSLDIIIVLLLV
ncbi:RNA polymerase sigma factor [Flavobacterium limnophilum]|uniref:RNA polymerase sigma factor n=1 Tax=Flavobacterium limnophilum TaxID=3003262 RepID=UPI0022AC1B49|nr:sigma-70 family RNA polymerase sigma factor [Flavobacterium limnophilum]